MSETEIHRNAYYGMFHNPDDSVVGMRWTEATADMSDDDFREGLERLAGAGESHGARGILVDVRLFRHSVGETLGVWRAQEIVPRYNAAGVRRFAYVAPAEMPVAAEEPDGPLDPAESFLTRFFHSEDDAVAWLGGG